MPHKNRDPRLLMLLVSASPFACCIGGAIVIWLYRQHMWSFGMGSAAFVIGYHIAGSLPRITNSIFKVCFRQTLAKYDFTEWVAIEMEKTGTHNKPHVFPDTVGIVVRLKDESYDIITLSGETLYLDVTNWSFGNVSKLKSTCAILVTDENGNDVIGYVITPIYKGSKLKIACDGKLRLHWFLEWIGAEPVDHTNA